MVNWKQAKKIAIEDIQHTPSKTLREKISTEYNEEGKRWARQELARRGERKKKNIFGW